MGAEALNALTRIRRFQILSADCEAMRDTAGKVAPTLAEETFAPSGKSSHGQKLNCYRLKDDKACQQLNCYRSHDDAAFRARLAELKSKMDQCMSDKEEHPEQETQMQNSQQTGTEKAQQETQMQNSQQTGTEKAQQE